MNEGRDGIGLGARTKGNRSWRRRREQVSLPGGGPENRLESASSRELHLLDFQNDFNPSERLARDRPILSNGSKGHRFGRWFWIKETKSLQSTSIGLTGNLVASTTDYNIVCLYYAVYTRELGVRFPDVAWYLGPITFIITVNRTNGGRTLFI